MGCFDWRGLSGPLELRNWRPGDQYQPTGTAGEEKIKTLFQAGPYSALGTCALAGLGGRGFHRLDAAVWPGGRVGGALRQQHDSDRSV